VARQLTDPKMIANERQGEDFVVKGKAVDAP
jgi:hypothetical protein